MRKITDVFIVILIIISLIFVTGQEGCPAPEQGARTGIDFTLISGVSFLAPPKTLEKNEEFKVGIHLENFNDKDEEGTVCIRDNLAESFYGIPSEGDGDCQAFLVKASEMISENEQNPGTANIYFPETGQYVYQGLPELNKPYDATLFVSMQYQQDSQITGTITSPDETQPEITQEAQPIITSVTKSIFMSGDNYQINLQIHLKKMQDVKIYSPDFIEKDKIYFFVEMKPLDLQCTDVNNNPIIGLIEFENEKIIKCFSLTSSKTQQSYPLVITLDYGVSIDREYKFEIKTK
jgi:hypothetical protein